MSAGADRVSPAPGARELALLFAWALAARACVLLGASHLTGWPPLDLAMLADGHSDMVLSQTFPSLYAGTQKLVPFVTTWRDDPYAFFTRFPLYPAAIGAASLAIDDRRLAALLVSQLAGAFAVLRFRALAGWFTPHAGFAAALFAVFPATWLETTSLAYTEGLLLLCAISAFHALVGGRLLAAAAWAGVAAVVQKHGFLVLLALGLSLVVSGRRGVRDLAPLALGLVPPALLGVWFWVVSGDPTTVLERNSRLFGDGGSAFALPFSSFAYGVMTRGMEFPGQFWARKAMLVLSLAFYAWALLGALARRERRQAPLVVWLATALAFCSVMGGVWAYYYFPRYALLGAPAALLLALDRVRVPQAPALRGLCLAAVAAGTVAAASGGAYAIWQIGLQVWSPRYYEQLRPLLH